VRQPKHFTRLDVLGGVEDRRVGPADNLFRLVAVDPPRTLVPEQDLAVQALADDRVLGGRLQDATEEFERLLSVAHRRLQGLEINGLGQVGGEARRLTES
jgi:hypothetical protein